MISGDGSRVNVVGLDWASTAGVILGSVGGGGVDIPEKLGATSEVLLIFVGFGCGQ